MIITKSVSVSVSCSNKKRLKEKGYSFSKIGDLLEVKVEDLSSGSHLEIQIKCDVCGEITIKQYCDYIRFKNKDIDTCKKCSMNHFYNNDYKKTIKKSFYDWCIDNKRQDVLDRWDYKLNSLSPNEVSFKTKKLFYFKCPCEKHSSEKKQIGNFVSGFEGSLNCKACNSFAEYLISIGGITAISTYWDYNKNKISPFEIAKQSSKKVWVYCQEKNYHGSYQITCNSFVDGCRCGYCNSSKTHPADSFGTYVIDNFGYDYFLSTWDENNTANPFKIARRSSIKINFVCENNKEHKYTRSCSNQFEHNFSCPHCNNKHGENICEDLLKLNGLYYDKQKTFKDCKDKNVLHFDFYIPAYNTCLEIDGKQHFEPVKAWRGNDGFDDVKRKDAIKNEYCLKNNIRLIRIKYDANNKELLKNEINNEIHKLINSCSERSD